MTTKTISNLLSKLSLYKNNPANIQRTILDHLTEITEGTIDIVDPSNPFVFALESSAVNTANFLLQNEINTRKQYPALAQTVEDLYLHMSDVDYLDRFASPAKTVFSIMIEKTELINSLVMVPGTNTKKITIPRNTEFRIQDYTFSLQYPIDIIQYSHGGFQLLYNNDIISPLQQLETNVVYWEMRKSSQTQQEWLYIEVDVYQFKIDSFNSPITGSIGFKESYTIDDQFYYCRVYYSNNNTQNKWKEIKTTHTDQVYDSQDPTAVLRVVNNTLEVSIPQIYLTTNKVSGKLRVDIYQTKGEINLVMEDFQASAFETEWKTIDPQDKTIYVSPLSTIKSILGFSRYTVSGGKNEITFEELRKRVINNSIGPQQLPITNVQIETSLSNKGFSVIKNVDVVTNRIFLASKDLPLPLNEKLITAGSASVETVVASVSDFQAHSMVRSNGQRTTLVPELIYRYDNGITSLLSTNDLNNLINATNAQKAEILNNSKYFYTPFHYVLDTTSEEFEMRPYYLDKPEIVSVSFVDQNTTTGLQINTVSYSIVRNNSGYKLVVESESNSSFKSIPNQNVRCYISFIPENESSRCYMIGEVSRSSNNNFIFTFDLTSNFDIDNKDVIYLSSFKMFDIESRNLGTKLTNDFDLIYTTISNFNTNSSNTQMDSLLIGVPRNPVGIQDSLGNPGLGITHEKIRLFFGNSLKSLWSRSRSVLSSTPYRTYSTTSVKHYTEDVYERDPVTGAIFKIDSAGNLTYNVKHKLGDPVKDISGNIVYNYKAGDIMLDSDGKPIPMEPERINRQLDITFIDAAYYFANDNASAEYRNQMVTSMVSWITNDIESMDSKLLDQTRMFFYPKTNMGTVKVLVDNAIVTNIQADQRLNVKIFVNNNVFENVSLKNAISRATIKTIDTLLKNSVISISDIIIKLMEVYARDVISVTVDGLGGNTNLQTVTLLNENERFSIRKRLTPLPNGSLIVEEDITINFILHELE